MKSLTIKQAKKILRNSLCSNDFINGAHICMNDNEWLASIECATENYKLYKEWIYKAPQLKKYNDTKSESYTLDISYNPALIFISELLNHPHHQTKTYQFLIKVAIQLMPNEIKDTYNISKLGINSIYLVNI